MKDMQVGIKRTKELIVEINKDDIFDVDFIIWEQKLQANAKEDKVKINEKGHMVVNIDQQEVGNICDDD